MGRAFHTEASPLAGKTVKVKAGVAEIGGRELRVEDWWDRVAGRSWQVCSGNPACIGYAVRAGMSGLPTDDEVVYGKVGPLGFLVHLSEIETSDRAEVAA